MKLLTGSLLLALLATVSIFAAEASKLPKVLLIGDSISMGYTPVVQTKLEGIAEVSHPPGNCQYTGYGLQQMKTWLGTNKWDVIHFNFGIWDTHLIRDSGALVTDETGPQPMPGTHIRYSPEKYRENLTKIVEMLEATGAKLIWASTTPVTARTGKRFEAIAKDNVVAAEIMKAHKIPINDLYALTMPHVKTYLGGDGCHFGVPGNEALAKQVAESIQQALSGAKPAAKPAK